MPKVSQLTILPKQVPIDWFDPTYWNEFLTVRERANYIKNGTSVALPHKDFCTTWTDCEKWKNMSRKEFMTEYGDAVLAEYKLPTQEELEQLEQWDEDEDEGDSGDDDEE
jgi:hypothetical protein